MKMQRLTHDAAQLVSSSAIQLISYSATQLFNCSVIQLFCKITNMFRLRCVCIISYTSLLQLILACMCMLLCSSRRQLSNGMQWGVAEKCMLHYSTACEYKQSLILYMYEYQVLLALLVAGFDDGPLPSSSEK
jgi:hypothetical protein